MRYSIYELDCFLNSIMAKWDTDNIDEAEDIYTRCKKHAEKIRRSQVFMFDNWMCEFISEENI